MKKLTFLIALICCWNFSIGQASYFPLEKGQIRHYTYSKEFYEQQNIDVSKLSMTVEILSEKKTINGKEYFISSTSTSFTGAQKSYVRADSEGSIYEVDEESGKEFMLVKGSPEVGDKWTDETGSGKLTATVIELGASIKTPITTYSDCLVIESVEDGVKTRGYFEKGVGMVAVTMNMNGTEQLFIYLISEE